MNDYVGSDVVRPRLSSGGGRIETFVMPGWINNPENTDESHGPYGRATGAGLNRDSFSYAAGTTDFDDIDEHNIVVSFTKFVQPIFEPILISKFGMVGSSFTHLDQGATLNAEVSLVGREQASKWDPSTLHWSTIPSYVAQNGVVTLDPSPPIQPDENGNRADQAKREMEAPGVAITPVWGGPCRGPGEVDCGWFDVYSSAVATRTSPLVMDLTGTGLIAYGMITSSRLVGQANGDSEILNIDLKFLNRRPHQIVKVVQRQSPEDGAPPEPREDASNRRVLITADPHPFPVGFLDNANNMGYARGAWIRIVNVDNGQSFVPATANYDTGLKWVQVVACPDDHTIVYQGSTDFHEDLTDCTGYVEMVETGRGAQGY